ncbi:S-layer homology domain-containing protein [Leucobacter sp. HY1908]
MSVKKPLAVVATAAMVVSGAAFGASAAQAEPVAPTTVYVPAADIAGPVEADESAVYNQWHFGPKDSEPQRVKTADQARNGLVVKAGTEAQIIKGNGNDLAVPTEAENVAALLGSLGVVASDNAAITYQVGVRVKDDVEEKGWKGWSTLRADASNPALWTSSKPICDVAAGTPTDLQAFIDGCGEDLYTISTGVLVYRPAADVLVSSFTDGATTTKFYAEPAAAAAGAESSAYVEAKDIRANEETYPGWHNGDKSGAEAYETVAGEKDATIGLKVTGKTQILNGFADEDFQANAAEFAAAMQIDVVEGEVWAQVPVFAYPEGAQKEVFTTLRALVPESGKLSEATEWVSSKQVGSLAANTPAPFADVLAALGDHDVIGYGFFVDTGKVATVKSISFNGATTTFAKDATPEEPVVPPKTGVELSDITPTTKFSKEITWLAETGVTTGYKQNDGTFKFMPKEKVTREAMAAFLYRLAPAEDKAGFKAPTKSPFADLKLGDKFYKEITWAHKQGLVTGWAQNTGLPKFQPKSNVDRDAVAAFMFRQHAPKGYKAAGESPFADMKKSDKFYKEIHWMGTTGLSTGNKQSSGKPTYKPKDNTTREAMAAFLYRADGLLG